MDEVIHGLIVEAIGVERRREFLGYPGGRHVFSMFRPEVPLTPAGRAEKIAQIRAVMRHKDETEGRAKTPPPPAPSGHIVYLTPEESARRARLWPQHPWYFRAREFGPA